MTIRTMAMTTAAIKAFLRVLLAGDDVGVSTVAGDNDDSATGAIVVATAAAGASTGAMKRYPRRGTVST